MLITAKENVPRENKLKTIILSASIVTQKFKDIDSYIDIELKLKQRQMTLNGFPCLHDLIDISTMFSCCYLLEKTMPSLKLLKN